MEVPLDEFDHGIGFTVGRWTLWTLDFGIRICGDSAGSNHMITIEFKIYRQEQGEWKTMNVKTG